MRGFDLLTLQHLVSHHTDTPFYIPYLRFIRYNKPTKTWTYFYVDGEIRAEYHRTLHTWKLVFAMTDLYVLVFAMTDLYVLLRPSRYLEFEDSKH